MSWIVQSLLLNRSTIREVSDLNSDEFNDLILVEKAIEKLKDLGLLTEEEIAIMEMNPSERNDITSNMSMREKWTFDEKFRRLCQRVAFFLGDFFTDDGYIEYMRKKYKLTDGQVKMLYNYIKSEYKHKVMRRPLNAS